MNTFIAKAKLFILTYKRLLLTIVPIIIFVPLILFIISAQTNTHTSAKNKKNNSPISQSPTQTEISPQTQVSLTPAEQTGNSYEENQPYSLEQEEKDIAFGKVKRDPNILTKGNISQETLSDGSIKYEYASSDHNRPDMQIVKDGVTTFKRDIVTNATISEYSEFLTNPPYALQGSAYYGPNAIILANPTLGIAVVYNPQTDQVYEQYLFQSTSVTDYVNTFGSDISNFNPAP